MNLLPPQIKQKVRGDYHSRLVVVGLSLVVLVVLALDCLLTVQTFSLSNDKANIAAIRTAEEQVGNRQAFLTARESITILNRRLKTLTPLLVTNNSPADVFETILDLKPKGVRITAITYATSTVERGSVALSGVADTRVHLLAFIDKLKNSDTFSEIESPVENLIRESEVPFNISVSIK